MIIYHLLRHPTTLQTRLSQEKLGECISHLLFSFIQNEKSPLRVTPRVEHKAGLASNNANADLACYLKQIKGFLILFKMFMNILLNIKGNKIKEQRNPWKTDCTAELYT